jgi:hypothetical protein
VHCFRGAGVLAEEKYGQAASHLTLLYCMCHPRLDLKETIWYEDSRVLRHTAIGCGDLKWRFFRDMDS